jgi:hypothetical protein
MLAFKLFLFSFFVLVIDSGRLGKGSSQHLWFFSFVFQIGSQADFAQAGLKSSFSYLCPQVAGIISNCFELEP